MISDPDSRRFQAAPRLALLLAVGAVLVLGLFGHTRLYYDYAWQLMSVQDYARGETTSPFVMRSADPADLTRDHSEWTIGYPLAYNAVGTVLTATGLSPATAHRVIATVAVLLGVLGWHLVFATCTALPPLGRAGALLAVSLSFNGAGMLGFMMPEVFMFATVPWQMWTLWHVVDPVTPAGRRLGACGALGACTGVAYTFRYLTALHGLPMLALAALWLAWRRPARWLTAGLVLAFTAALPVAVVSLANYLHIGAINSTSGSLPWSMTRHWPDLTQWLLVVTGPVQALFGTTLVFDRAGSWLGQHWLGLSDYPSLKLCQLGAAVGPTLLTALLLARFAPRNRLFWGGLAGLGGTALGLLCLYGISSLPQPDTRYSVGPAMLLWPALAAAGYAAVRHSAGWRIATALLALPAALALVLAFRAHQLTLFPTGSTSAAHIRVDGNVNPAELRAMVSRRLPPDAGEVLWMCFQPGVLYALGGRHVFESYTGQPVDYRSRRPVTLVVLRDRAQVMHPATYESNYAHLDIMTQPPDFSHGDYDVFIRHIGPAGLMSHPSTR